MQTAKNSRGKIVITINANKAKQSYSSVQHCNKCVTILTEKRLVRWKDRPPRENLEQYDIQSTW